MKNLSCYTQACVLLWIIGYFTGLVCGVSIWVFACVEIVILAISGWGVWKTYFVYHNRYESVRLMGMSGSLITAIGLGYVTVRLICWLIA